MIRDASIWRGKIVKRLFRQNHLNDIYQPKNINWIHLSWLFIYANSSNTRILYERVEKLEKKKRQIRDVPPYQVTSSDLCTEIRSAINNLPAYIKACEKPVSSECCEWRCAYCLNYFNPHINTVTNYIKQFPYQQPSSCLTDKEEDEIYGFGYGVFGKQMLQRQQQQKQLLLAQPTQPLMHNQQHNYQR